MGSIILFALAFSSCEQPVETVVITETVCNDPTHEGCDGNHDTITTEDVFHPFACDDAVGCVGSNSLKVSKIIGELGLYCRTADGIKEACSDEHMAAVNMAQREARKNAWLMRNGGYHLPSEVDDSFIDGIAAEPDSDIATIFPCYNADDIAAGRAAGLAKMREFHPDRVPEQEQ